LGFLPRLFLRLSGVMPIPPPPWPTGLHGHCPPSARCSLLGTFRSIFFGPASQRRLFPPLPPFSCDFSLPFLCSLRHFLVWIANVLRSSFRPSTLFPVPPFPPTFPFLRFFFFPYSSFLVSVSKSFPTAPLPLLFFVCSFPTRLSLFG